MNPHALHRRGFISAFAAAGAALAAANHAHAQATLDAEAARNGGRVALKWRPADQPTSVFMSADPAAPRSAMRRLAEGVRGGAIAVDAPAAPRPYFLLVARDGRTCRVAERVLPLQGGWNFRDLGGYRATDGRQVRWGQIYRSGVMSDLTPEDMRYLRDLGVAVICDLRSQQERTSAPNPFLNAEGPRVSAAADYSMTDGPGRGGVRSLGSAMTIAQYVDSMSDAYVDTAARRLTAHFTDIFARLVAGEAPLAFNCSGGKDRTGTAAAMILSVLGVPRATVVADYGLTGVYLPKSAVEKLIADGGARLGLTPQTAAALEAFPPAVRDFAYRSDPSVMRVALEKIDKEFGGPIALAKQKYGLDDRKIELLRSRYLV